ncbi:putative talin-1-like [Penaeus vannamei]|uniref:Putative talin-1-like n=1 Tax=Penaeus vannamei TaxID=6689 RepID=A0A423SL58_PENVA|nr:putative talin-1-like [Penaeus vannamei]
MASGTLSVSSKGALSSSQTPIAKWVDRLANHLVYFSSSVESRSQGRVASLGTLGSSFFRALSLVNWVDHSKTLREQGIDETEILLLRRKYFFSDQNIDSRDPVQLGLLYVQCRDAILDGTHPVTLERACSFAGIQCQIQFGDHVDSKHKPGFLDLKEFLPQSYVKTKGIEKKIFQEHKTHAGKNELDAKVTYVGLARSLKTYGVTFFLVKEKMKSRNKLVPRLLGVTKDSVLRLDEKTKEILKTWPLTTVRRWAASPNTFTLDFGDYSDQYYSVQTTEGEQISQLIAGYIDIILKKQRAKDHIGIEGDDGSAMVEDTVSPIKASIIQHGDTEVHHAERESVSKPAVMRPGVNDIALSLSFISRRPIVLSFASLSPTHASLFALLYLVSNSSASSLWLLTALL